MKENFLNSLIDTINGKSNWGSKMLKEEILKLNLRATNADTDQFEQRLVSAVVSDVVAYVDESGSPTFGKLAILEFTNSSIRNQAIAINAALYTNSF